MKKTFNKVFIITITLLNKLQVGCSAGCISNICLQTPVLARRSLAYSQTGEMKNAFQDVEQAIVLDTKNPDLYCVRLKIYVISKHYSY